MAMSHSGRVRNRSPMALCVCVCMRALQGSQRAAMGEKFRLSTMLWICGRIVGGLEVSRLVMIWPFRLGMRSKQASCSVQGCGSSELPLIGLQGTASSYVRAPNRL